MHDMCSVNDQIEGHIGLPHALSLSLCKHRMHRAHALRAYVCDRRMCHSLHHCDKSINEVVIISGYTYGTGVVLADVCGASDVWCTGLNPLHYKFVVLFVGCLGVAWMVCWWF